MRQNFDWFPCQHCRRYKLEWLRDVVCRGCGWTIAYWIADLIDRRHRI